MWFTTAGVYTYRIPSWVQSGHLIDIVGIGGGTGGALFSSLANTGGLAPAWVAQTFTYGIDIPNGTTQLMVQVGSGGMTQSVGGTTYVGYGMGSTPALDAVGTYNHGASVASLTLTHTVATSGAFIFVPYGWTGNTGTFTCTNYTTGNGAANAFTQSPASGHGIGVVIFPNIPAGTQTIVINGSGTLPQISAASVSYTGVGAASSSLSQSYNCLRSTGASSTALSHLVSCGQNSLIAQTFAAGDQTAVYSGFAGGTNRIYGDTSGVAALSLSDATAPTTFSATSTTSNSWGSVAVVLAPTMSTILFTATRGQAFNTTGTITGTSPGNETFPASGIASKTFIGGAAQPTSGGTGNAPGGGGAGTSASGTLPGGGGDGAVYITARRS